MFWSCCIFHIGIGNHFTPGLFRYRYPGVPGNREYMDRGKTNPPRKRETCFGPAASFILALVITSLQVFFGIDIPEFQEIENIWIAEKQIHRASARHVLVLLQLSYWHW